MPNRSILPLVIASVAAAFFTKGTDQRPFEEIRQRAVIADLANAPGSRCPLSRETIEREAVELLWVCLAHGLVAFEAARRYPVQAAKVFAVYEEEDIFWQMLDRYGHEVIPVIASYVEHGSRELQIRQTLSDALGRLWAGQRPKWELANLTPEQIGLLAMHRLTARGHEMLAEFEVVDGVATRKPMTSVLLGAKDVLIGDLGNLESILVRGKRLPTWREVGLAGIDATLVVGGIGAVAKVARASRGLAVEKSGGRLMVEGAFETITAVVRTGKRTAPIALAYLAIAHPSLLAPIGGWIAEQLGLNRVVGIFVVYFYGFLAVWWLLWPLISCVRFLWRSFHRLPAIWMHCMRLLWRSEGMLRAA